jgi:cytochrome P450
LEDNLRDIVARGNRADTVSGEPTGVERLRLLYRFVRAGDQLPEVLEASVQCALRDAYGGVVRLRVPFTENAYLITTPEFVREVLEERSDSFRLFEPRRRELCLLFGDSTLTERGDAWQRRRQAVGRALGESLADRWELSVRGIAAARAEQWARKDAPVDVVSESSELLLDVLGNSLFGQQFNEGREAMLEALGIVDDIFPRQSSLIPTAPRPIPSPHNTRLSRFERKMDDALDLLVGEQSEQSGPTPLSTDLRSDGSQLTDGEVRDELRSLFVAGLVTGTALAWTLYALADHPRWQREIRRDTGTNVANPGDVTASDDPLGCVLRETLRLYPPLPPTVRTPTATTTVGEYRLRPGSRVFLSQLPIHRSSDFWADPLSFQPKRFAEAADPAAPRYSYFPFGGGQRVCVGRRFALRLLRSIVSELVAGNRLRVADVYDGIGETPANPGSIGVDCIRL